MEGGQTLAELWRNIWPWDDLNAKGPPERWLKLGLDVLPALTALVAQGPSVARLLRSDDLGRLLIAGPLNPGSNLTAAVTPGGSLFTVADGSIFPAGTYFTIIPGPNRAGAPDGTVYQVKTNKGNQLTTFTGGPTNVTYQVGDIAVVLTRQYAPAQAPYQAGQIYVFSSPAVGTMAKVVIGGALNQTIRVLRITGDLISTGAQALQTWLQATDELSTVFYKRAMGLQGLAEQTDHLTDDDLYLDIPGHAGQNVTIGFGGVGTMTVESVSVLYTVVQN